MQIFIIIDTVLHAMWFKSEEFVIMVPLNCRKSENLQNELHIAQFPGIHGWEHDYSRISDLEEYLQKFTLR